MAASEAGYDAEFAYHDEIRLTGDYLPTVHVHKLDSGRWVVATWNARNQKYESTDLSPRFAKANPSALYCYARTLDALVRHGDVRTYRSALDAVRSALSEYIYA